MSLLNVLNDFPYRKRYYLKHPLCFLQEIHWNLTAAWKRATKGYAGRDVAEMDEYLLHIIANMLHDMAHGDAFPGNDEFPTFEDWSNWCTKLGDRFESLWEKNWSEGEGKNPYAEEFDQLSTQKYWMQHKLRDQEHVTTTLDISDDHMQEVWHKYADAALESSKRRSELIVEAYKELATHHDYLWI